MSTSYIFYQFQLFGLLKYLATWPFAYTYEAKNTDIDIHLLLHSLSFLLSLVVYAFLPHLYRSRFSFCFLFYEFWSKFYLMLMILISQNTE